MAAFWLYVLAAPPGFYWLDSAELSAAAVRLGSPHPTGFPLYCVLAKAATFVPVGELSFRINLLSAGCAALAVLWLTRLISDACRDDVPALLGAASAGAVLCLALPFFRHATIAEVHAPTAALLTGSLVLIDRVARGADARWGLSLALVAGLGAGLHVTYGLLAVPILVFWILRLYRGARWPLVAPLLTVLVAGALIAYLPVRSATGRTAAVDWGHPDRLDRLIEHLTHRTAESVRDAHADELGTASMGQLAQHATVFANDMADAVGPVALLAAVFGLGWLLRQRRSRWLAAALAVLALGDVVYSLWINPTGSIDLQNGVPLILALCACAGAGVAWFARYLGRAGSYVGAVACVLSIVPVALMSLPEVWPASAPGGAMELPRAWSEAALDSTPARGVAVVQNDSTAAGLLYLTAAEGARPDVVMLVRQRLGDVERTRAMLARSGLDGRKLDARQPLAAILGSGRPVAWELGQDAVPVGLDMTIAVPLVRLGPAGAGRDRAARGNAGADDRDLAAAATWLAARFEGPGGRDRNARRVHAQTLTALGRAALALGNVELASLLFEQAVVVHPVHVAALINLGMTAAQRGDLQAAIDWTERALRVAPERADAWALAAMVALRAGHVERARARLRRAQELDATNADVQEAQRQVEKAGGSGAGGWGRAAQ